MIKQTMGLICCSMNEHNLTRDLLSQVASDWLLSLKKGYKALISQKKTLNQSDKKHKGWRDNFLLDSSLSNLASTYIGTNTCLPGRASVSLHNWVWTEFRQSGLGDDCTSLGLWHCARVGVPSS